MTGRNGYVEFSSSSFGGSQTMRINWSETYDQAANASDVTITSVQLKSNTYVGQSYYGNMVIKINGDEAVRLNEQNNQVYLNNFNEFATVNFNGAPITGSVTGIDHNTDGSKTVAISIEKNGYDNPAFWSGSPGLMPFTAGSVNIALTNIPRIYTLSISAGAGVTVTVKRGSTPLTNGDSITYGDVLTITFTPSTGYAINIHTVNGTTFASGGTKTVDGDVSVVATATPQLSTLTASNGTFGTAQTIGVTRQSSSYTHTITYSCAGQTGTIVTQSGSTSISWTPPNSLMTGIPNATSASCVLTCTTYSGNTALGSTSVTITLSVPSSAGPYPSLTISDANGYESTYGAYVQGQSRLSVSITDGTQYGATAASRSTTANGSTYTAASFTTNPIISDGLQSVDVSITDSRGFTGSASTSYVVLAYDAPALTSFGVHRCDAQGTDDPNGEYFYVSYDITISPLNNLNSKIAKYWYKKTTQSTWTEVPITLSSYTQSGVTAPVAISTDSSYDVYLRVQDDFYTINRQTVLSTTPSVISFMNGGSGAAFGKAAEMAGMLDVAWGLYLRGGIYLPTAATYDAAWDATNEGRMAIHNISGRNETVITIKRSLTDGIQFDLGVNNIWYRGLSGTTWTSWMVITAT